MARLNLIASLLILLMAAVVLGWLIPNYVPFAHDPGDLSPNMVPLISMSICALAAILLGISSWRKRGAELDESQDNEAAEELVFGLGEIFNLVLWLVFSAIIWLLFKYACFEVAAGFAIAAGMLYGGLRKVLIIIPTAVLAPIIISRIAWYGLSIQLP